MSLNALPEKLNLENCAGCGACAARCPVSCIRMDEDAEGFYRPYYDAKQCVHCGACEKVCPQIHSPTLRKMSVGMAAQIKDRRILEQSSSGGIFSALAESTLRDGGIVAGVGWDAMTARHLLISDFKELSRLRGSKYVQSDAANVLRPVREALENGKEVLFSGTPCQVAGLKAYLGKDYERLLTVGIICHGTPSPGLFRQYLRGLEAKRGRPVTEYRFRDKGKYGWGLYYYYYCGRAYSGMAQTEPYYRAFLAGETYQECCYQCQYARMERVEDITLGDFWGIERVLPDFPSKGGASLVLANEKGMEFLKRVSDNLLSVKVDIAEAANYQRNLREPSERPAVRDTVYQNYPGDCVRTLRRFRDISYRVAGILPSPLLRTLRKGRQTLRLIVRRVRGHHGN